MHVMDERLEQMCRNLKNLGVDMGEVQMPDLGPCELNHVEDKEIHVPGESGAPGLPDDPSGKS